MKISKHVFFFVLSLLIFMFGVLFPIQFAHPITFILIMFILAIYALVSRKKVSSETSDSAD